MSDDLTRFLTVIAAVALPLALIALTRRVFRQAAAVIDHAPTIRTYCGTCGHDDCVCGTGVGDEAEAWLHGRSEVYDWSRDEGSGLA